MVYLMTLSASQTIEGYVVQKPSNSEYRMVYSLISYELETTWNVQA
jgi:hypothetical protein